MTLYNSFNNILKGSDLTIYCVLSSLEDWQRKHQGKLPEVVFIQIDGGCENANKYLIAICELLCAKRIVKDIWITRLPVGHTHSDIDACFGHIWKWMRGRPIETLDDYFHGIRKAFENTSLNPTVKFIYVIPNYQEFLDSHIDKCFGHYTKTESTQHCWRIQAVESSVMFPLGIKTLCRKYSSDRVVELVKKDPSKCHSSIGRSIGLEPITAFSKWFPDKHNDLPGRNGIEGFYILKSIPSCDRFPIAPFQFEPNGIKAIQKCYLRAKQRWTNLDDPIRQWWDQWITNHAPFCGTAEEYLQTRLLHFPLGSYLVEENVKYIPMWTVAQSLEENTVSTSSFNWPSEYVYCLLSVTSSWSRAVGPYRSQILSSDPFIQGKLNDYKERTLAYYHGLRSKSSVNLFINIVKYRIDDKNRHLKDR